MLPIAFLVFYSKHDVSEIAGNAIHWKGGQPLSAAAGHEFAFSVSCAFYYLLTGIAKPLLPFFGIYLSGIRGTIAFLLLALLEAYFARAFFTLKPTGWWVAVFTRGVLFISAVITVTRSSLMDAYVKMGMSSRELQQLNSNPLAHFQSHSVFRVVF